MWKYILASALLIALGTVSWVFFLPNIGPQRVEKETSVVLSPFSKILLEKPEPRMLAEIYPMGKPINILLLGIDRRNKAEYSYRTDIMILLSVDMETNNAVLVSLPRDLWYNGNKLNALYIVNGWEALQEATKEATGLRPDKYVLTDFEDFSWIVDAVGGIPVHIDRAFTDSSYPIDETLEYQTVSFIQGNEILTGERALMYSRSRKGTNGEGSDWARMRRQHKILVGMLDAVSQPSSLFNPMVVEEAFKMVTQGRMDTNLALTDTKYLWDFYKDRDKYTIHSLFLDYEYLYSPPPENYGGAWTIVPIDGSYETFQQKVQNRLMGIMVDGSAQENTDI